MESKEEYETSNNSQNFNLEVYVRIKPMNIFNI